VRITGGQFRGRKLLSVKSDKLRPATDRLRETMFNILSNIMELEGSCALDLYAGTGSVGFEAISRGATTVVFVEADPKIADVLRANASALNVADLCDIRTMKVEKFLKSFSDIFRSGIGKFNMVYVDPPYAINDTTQRIVEDIIAHKIVNEDGIICVEHSKGYSPPTGFLLRQKIFGSTILSFIKPVLRPHEEKKCQSRPLLEK